MRLIGITGAARSGKDSAAEFLIPHGFERIAFADPIKAMAFVGLGIDPDDYDDESKEEEIDWLGVSPRRVWQTLGTEWGRAVGGPDLWLKVAWRKMAEAKEERPTLRGIVFTDVRFDNEAQAIRNSGGKVIKIVRPDARAVAPHVSERGLSANLIDDVIVNDGTLAQLREAVLKEVL